jgi:hypothetical protein
VKIKHSDIIIPEDNPFANCKLGRKKYAEALTSIINSYADGFVLAINNEWGTGKTTFIKMWQQHLTNEGYKTLYFNAWENDFESNPLVAILSELKTLNPKSDDATFKSLLRKGAIISQKIFPIVVKALAEKYLDTDGLTEAIGKLTEAATDILKEEVDEYANKKKGLIEFRTELAGYVKNNNNGKPLIFFIDELDRCRPDYSVEVLEQIKHFFNVPGIVFVMSIDKIQLGNAIRGFYGSENINADEYLSRFIDLEYIIPAPKTGVFCGYLYDYFQFDDFFESPQRSQIRVEMEMKQSLLKMATVLFDNGNMPLRQQEKIFAQVRLVLGAANRNNYAFPSLLFLLIYIRSHHFNLYRKIQGREIDLQELITQMEKLIPPNIEESDLNMFLYLETLLIFFYNNYYKVIYKNSKLFGRRAGTEEKKLLVTSKADKSPNNQNYLSLIVMHQEERYNHMQLNPFLDQIDLMQILPA